MRRGQSDVHEADARSTRRTTHVECWEPGGTVEAWVLLCMGAPLQSSLEEWDVTLDDGL